MDMYICKNKNNQRKNLKLKRNAIKLKIFYGYKSNFTIIIEKWIQTDRKQGDLIKKVQNEREPKGIRK